jgi:hypothetical protein
VAGRGRGWGALSLLERLGDDGQYTLDVFKDLVVPKPQHAIAALFKVGGSLFIPRIVGVLTAVNFNYQSALMAGEIAEIRTDRCLTAEVIVLER